MAWPFFRHGASSRPSATAAFSPSEKSLNTLLKYYTYGSQNPENTRGKNKGVEKRKQEIGKRAS
jgi:hypothetical protein